MSQFNLRTSNIVLEFLSAADTYQSPYALSVSYPDDLTSYITKKAALKTASISVASSLTPGRFSYLSILPELFSIYRIQSKMVIDIAALYGKDQPIDKSLLLYCMFNHIDPNLFKQIIIDTGKRFIIRPISIHIAIQTILKATQTITGKSFKKGALSMLPLLGFIISGSLNYIYTKRIGETASKVFSKEIFITEPEKNE